MSCKTLFLVAKGGIFLLVLMALSATTSYGDPFGYIQGYVQDESNIGIDGALVETNIGYHTTSISEGFYSLPHPVGTCIVTASGQGYEPLSMKVDVQDGLSSILNFTLSPEALRLESVYPTLGAVGEDLDVSLTGLGFDDTTRVSMMLNVGNEETIIGAVDTPGSAYDVAVSGDYAFIGDRYDIQIIDISDPANPNIVEVVDVSNRRLTISGNYIYAAFSPGLQIIDVSDPLNPSILAPVAFGPDAYDVEVIDNKAFVGSDDLYIVDVSNPLSPVVLGSTGSTSLSSVQGATAVGNTAYVVEYDNDFFSVDITDPTNPLILDNVILNSTWNPRDVEVDGNYAFVAGGWAGLHVVDITDPANCFLVAQIELPSYAEAINIAGERAYIPNNYGGLQVVDIRDPESPQIIGYIDTPGTVRGVCIDGSTAYLAADLAGLQIVDVSNPELSNYIGTVETGDFTSRIRVVGDIAYVVDKINNYGRLQIVDISEPSDPTIIGYIAMPNFNAVAIVDDKAYLACSRYLYIYNISNPASPQYITSISTPNVNSDIAVVDGKAYLSSRHTYSWTGLVIIDVDPESETYRTIIGEAPVEYSQPWGVAVAGDYAYLACNSPGLQIIDISNPFDPQLRGLVDTPGSAWGVTVEGDLAYVADYGSGLQIIDVSDPDAPEIVGAVDTPDTAKRVMIKDNYAYVSDTSTGVQLIDVSDPEQPLIVGSVDTLGNAQDCYVRGNVAYIASGQAGQLIIVPVPVEITPVTLNSDTDISVTLPGPVVAGHYTIRVFNPTQNHELYGAVSFTENLHKLNSKAIIVAGGGPEAPGEIWDETKLCANKAYDVLVQQGYDHESIYYLSMETGNDFIDKPSLDFFLADAISNWSADATELLLYFVDHGQADNFILYADGDYAQTLSVEELDIWLDDLQNGTMDGPVTFIYDACQSGTFLSKLRPPEGKEFDRIVITSASDEPAYFLDQGVESFSFQFWTKILWDEGNLGSAFTNAKQIMQGYQSALIDANGNGISNEDEDLLLAGQSVIRRGSPTLFTVQPAIGDVFVDDPVLNGSLVTTIRAQDVVDADAVWAQIIPPDVNPEAVGVPITDLPTVQLTDLDHDGVYTADYDGFTVAGSYLISVRAVASEEIYSYISGQMTTQSIYSAPLYDTVIQTVGLENIEADTFEEDDTSNQAKVVVINAADSQPHNFHVADDQDWVEFYGVEDEEYTIKASNLSPLCNLSIEVYLSGIPTPVAELLYDPDGDGQDKVLGWTCPQNGLYYVKVGNANNNFGENTRYDLKVYTPTAGIPGELVGQVLDSQGVGIGGAVLLVDGENASTVTYPNGYFIMILPSGTHTITIRADGYENHPGIAIEILSENRTTQDFTLFQPGEIIPGDVNHDLAVDLSDAILALQLTSKMDPVGIHFGADVNSDGKIGVAEVVFILQKEAGLR